MFTSYLKVVMSHAFRKTCKAFVKLAQMAYFFLTRAVSQLVAINKFLRVI